MLVNIELNFCNVLQTGRCLIQRNFSEPTQVGLDKFYCINEETNNLMGISFFITCLILFSSHRFVADIIFTLHLKVAL